MNQWNPYAPPQAQAQTQAVEADEAKCFRDGNVVVVPAGVDLPPRCIRCNAPAQTPIKEVKLYWHNPLLYLLILFNILVYAIAALIARRTAKVSPGLCQAHTAHRQQRMWIFVGGGFGSCAIGMILLTNNRFDPSIAFFLLGIVALVIGMFATRKVFAREITNEHARLGGCKEPFLASLQRHRALRPR